MSFKVNVSTQPPESKLQELTEIKWYTVAYSNPSQPDLLVMRDSQDGYMVIKSGKVYALDSYNATLDEFPYLSHVEPSIVKVTISIDPLDGDLNYVYI